MSASEPASPPPPHYLIRTAYTVYGIAHRAHGHTGSRDMLERLAHAALRDALLGLSRTRDALLEIRTRLESGAFAGLREDDLAGLRSALAPLAERAA